MTGSKRSAEEAGLEEAGSPVKRTREETEHPARAACKKSFCDHDCPVCGKYMFDYCNDNSKELNMFVTYFKCMGECDGAFVCKDCISEEDSEYCVNCVGECTDAYDETKEPDYDSDCKEPSVRTRKKHPWAIVKAECTLCFEYRSGAPCAEHGGHVCIICIGDVRGTRSSPQPVCTDCHNA
jgi:hypothetical protein